MAIRKTKITYNFKPEFQGLIDALNLFVIDVHDDISQLNPNIVTALPTAEKDKRGSFMILEASATDDQLHFCIQNAAGGFEFKQIQFV